MPHRSSRRRQARRLRALTNPLALLRRLARIRLRIGLAIARVADRIIGTPEL